MIRKKIFSHLGFILAFAGLVMMCLGAMRGEAAEVFEKSIRICLECIGIG